MLLAGRLSASAIRSDWAGRTTASFSPWISRIGTFAAAAWRAGDVASTFARSEATSSSRSALADPD